MRQEDTTGLDPERGVPYFSGCLQLHNAMQLHSRDQTQATSQLIGQFDHVTASARCKQPEKHGIFLAFHLWSCGSIGCTVVVMHNGGGRSSKMLPKPQPRPHVGVARSTPSIPKS